MPPYIQATYEGPTKVDYATKAKIAMDALKDHPEDREYIYAYTAHFLYRDGQVEATIAHCREVLPTLTISECRSDTQRVLIWALESTGQPEAAIEVRRQLVEESDHRSFELEDLAKAYEKIGDAGNAIKYYEELIEEEEGNSDTEVFTRLAELYEDRKDFAASARAFAGAARNNCHNSSWLWYNTGRAVAMAGDEEEAMFYFRMALKIDPKDPNAHYGMGKIYQDRQDMYRALHHYTEALKEQPDFPIVYNNLAALAFNEESDISGAIRNIETALELNPDQQLLITLYRNLAILYDKVADYDKHEYYKGKMLEAIGFPIEFIDDDEEEDEDGNEV